MIIKVLTDNIMRGWWWGEGKVSKGMRWGKKGGYPKKFVVMHDVDVEVIHVSFAFSFLLYLVASPGRRRAQSAGAPERRYCSGS